MTTYIKLTDFATKDSLPPGDPAKVVKGTELDDEFNAIATANGSKANTNDAALTGTTTAVNLTVSGTFTAVEINGGTY
tara:strand:- start:11746 stop:11979 length:234 start_codon:yes stop_codon:yes gene_type:complete